MSAHRDTERDDMLQQRDRGSVSVELAILAPAMLVLLAFAVFCGRAVIADNSVEEAARSAARAASIAVDATSAVAAATSSAETTLAVQDLQCVSTEVSVDTSGFTAPIGVPAQVTVVISCSVGMGDLLLPGLPGVKTVTAAFTSPIDAYRERA